MATPGGLVDGSISTEGFARFDREMAEGRVSAALVTGMLAAQMGPAVFRYVPRPVLEMLTAMAMKSEGKKAAADDVTMRMLAPTLHYDFRIVAETDGKVGDFAGVAVPVLLLGDVDAVASLLLRRHANELLAVEHPVQTSRHKITAHGHLRLRIEQQRVCHDHHA